MLETYKWGGSPLMALLCLWGSLGTTRGEFSCPSQLEAACHCYRQSERSTIRAERWVLDCSSSDLLEVPVIDFEKNTKLFKLTLRNNSIATLSYDKFINRLHVHTVDISDNPFRNNLEPDILSKITVNLKRLLASKISVRLDKPVQFIKGLSSLEELDLSRNLEFSRTIPATMFLNSGLHALKRLSLAGCSTYVIKDGAFRGLHNLRSLDLSSNFLSRVPKAIQSLSMLRKLNLRRNDVTVINRGDFQELHCLEELDLSYNLLGQMKAFRNGAFYGVENSLRYLNLQDSDLAFIPTLAMTDLTKLRHLDIADNKISFMSNRSFSGAYRLEVLDISGNPWLLDDQMFDAIRDSVVNLSMRRIGLQSVPVTPLATLNKLRKVDLAYNDLTELRNDSLSGIKARWLIFKGNQIMYIDAKAFSQFKRAVKVDLSYNNLESLGFVFRSPRCTFFNLNVSQNYLNCNCEVERLINSLQVEELAGDCLATDGEQYSLSDRTIRHQLESHCGKSERTFCAWWAPKPVSAAVRLHALNIGAIVTSLICLCTFPLGW